MWFSLYLILLLFLFFLRVFATDVDYVCECVCGQGECLKTTEGPALSALIFPRSVVVCIVLKSTGVQF